MKIPIPGMCCLSQYYWPKYYWPRSPHNLQTLLSPQVFASQNYVEVPIVEDITQFSCRTWRNQAWIWLEDRPPMLTHFHSAEKHCADCWGRPDANSLAQLWTECANAMSMPGKIGSLVWGGYFVEYVLHASKTFVIMDINCHCC